MRTNPRFAVVAPDRLAAWQAACLQRMSAEGRLALWIRKPGPRQNLVWRWIERRSRALRPAAKPAALAAAPRLDLADGWRSVAEAVTKHELDFILDLSDPGLDPERFAGLARHGLWRFWHGAAAGDGSLLAHLERDEPLLRVAVIALGGRDAAVRFEGFFRRRRSAIRSLDHGLLAAADCLVAACRRRDDDHHPARPATPRAIRPPVLSNGAALRLLLAEGRRLLGLMAESFRLEIWNVGVLPMPVAEALRGIEGRQIAWKPEGPLHRYDADPMTLPDRPGILCEEFSYGAGRGRICAFDGAGWQRSRTAGLDTGVHMSYPYLLEDGGEILCVPESSEAGGVRLFRARAFPGQWEHVATLITDFGAVDPTIFHHDGIWWLCCGRAGELSESLLFLWHADSLHGPWRPHPKNPVKVDIRSSRPAGPPVTVDGVLYRPAQDCSRTYGGALAINRVTVLDRERFAEEVVARLDPDPAGPYPDGLHTLCGNGEVTLVDGKRTCFHLAAPALKAWSALAHRRTLRRRVPL